jgi:hypothetical protein
MKTNVNKLSLSKVRITKLTQTSTIKGGSAGSVKSWRPNCPATNDSSTNGG